MFKENWSQSALEHSSDKQQSVGATQHFVLIQLKRCNSNNIPKLHVLKCDIFNFVSGVQFYPFQNYTCNAFYFSF